MRKTMGVALLSLLTMLIVVTSFTYAMDKQGQPSRKKEAVIATVNVGRYPHGIAVNEEANCVYVANLNQRSISVIDGATNEVIDILEVGLTPGRVLRELLRRDGLLPYFRALTFSDETGATKPLPEQFLRTLAILQVRPEKAAHIGDLPETDLAGARAVGMRAVLFLGVSHRQDGRLLADAVFEEYDELEELLRRLE